MQNQNIIRFLDLNKYFRIFTSQMDDEVLKYSRLSLKLVVGLGLRIYCETQFRIGSYTFAAFSGIDLP